MPIKLKLITILLAIALIPLLFFSVLTFHNYQESLQSSRIGQLQELAAFRSERIEAHFKEAERRVSIAQDSYAVRKNLPTLVELSRLAPAPELRAAKQMVDDVLLKNLTELGALNIMLLGPEGKIVYATEPGYPVDNPLDELGGIGETAFEKGKTGFYLSGIFRDKNLGNTPTVLITAPVLDLNGKFAGVIASEMDVRPVYRLIADTTGLGKTGELLVGKKINQQVLFLNPLRHDPQAAFTKFIPLGGSLGGPVQAAVQGKTGSGRLTDYRGKKVIAAWRYIPSVGWGIVAKIDAEEAFAEIAKLRSLMLLILCLVFILSAIMAVSISESIAGPLKSLTQAVRAVGSGNLDVRIASDSEDEIGELSRAFDRMINDLKNLGVARDAERKRFYDVLETLPVYVILLTKDYHVSFANKFFRERFGESYGKPCYEFLFNRAEPCENCETFKVMKTGAYHHWEWTGPDKRNYDIHDYPFIDADGSTLVMEMGIDITEQKKAQAMFREASAYNRNLIEVSLDPLVTISPEGKITDVNEATIKITGVSREALIGTDFSDYFTESLKARDGYLQVFSRGSVKDYPLTIRHRDGTLTEVLYNASVYKDGDGNVLGVFAAARDVTAQKTAEAELRRHRDNLEVMVGERTLQLKNSEDDLKRAQAVAHTGSWRLDVRLNQLTWSEETYRMFGVSAGEPMTYEKFLSMVHPDDRGYVSDKWTGAMSGEPYDVEHRIVVDGKIKWVRELAELEFESDGRLSGGFGTVQDITWRKEIEEALAKEKSNLQTIFEVVHVGLLLIDEKGIVRRVNDTVVRWLGKEPSLCCGGQPGDVVNCVHALSSEKGCGTSEHCTLCPIRRTFETVLSTGKSVHDVEAQATVKLNGKTSNLWLEISVDPLDLDGKKHAILAMNNISSRKMAEKALYDSETKYRIIADNNYAFEFWINPEGRYIYASPSCKRITGYAPEEYFNDPGMRTRIVHPDDVGLVKAHIKGAEHDKGGELEYRIFHRDGKVRWISHVCQPIYDQNGAYLGIRGGNRDITNRKHAEEALKRSNENLEQFAYVASHDLQEPLRIMASYSQLLQQRYKEKMGKDADDFIFFIVDAARRMQKLITDLLSYSRAGRMEVADEEVDCNIVFGKVIYNLGPVIEDTGAIVTSDLLPSISGNETGLTQLFQNLIGNGIKFRKENAAPKIHVSSKRQEAEWLFTVKDNGIGMEEKYHDKIFLIFQRLHSREKYPGTGIGLSICKKIVELHGGRIWVESHPGRGSTFYFTIPVNPAEEEWHE